MIHFNLLQVCPSVLSFLLAVLFIPSLNVLSPYFNVNQLGVSSHCLNFNKFHETAPSTPTPSADPLPLFLNLLPYNQIKNTSMTD